METKTIDIDRNTYRVFDIENGVPTFAYEAHEAFADKVLVPPRGYSVPLKFVRQGVKYNELSAKEKEEWESKEQLAEREEVLPSELNQFLYNDDTVDKMLQTLVAQGIKVAGGERLGKTIVFAANNAHAELIVKRYNHHYRHHAGRFARVITYKEQYADSLIDEFKGDKTPLDPNLPLTIAVSVDMLDTGIDVPEVVNLVFFKVVQSRVKFLQMLGRGTRLCADLFGPAEDKREFLVFDYCQNLEYFEDNLTIQRIKRNRPVTAMDLEQLDEMLFQASGMEERETYDSSIHPDKPLGVFIRELVGLDRHAAKAAFADFLDEKRMNSTQIQFINTLIDYFTQSGVMEENQLAGLPFSDIHSASIFGLFDDSQILAIRQKIEWINGNAEAVNDSVTEKLAAEDNFPY
jgi:type I site-specific restriction endonuclease